MEIKNFGDLKRAILEGKKIEYYSDFIGASVDLDNDNWHIDFHANRYRTKPEKEYVPFTADDWRGFFCRFFIREHSGEKFRVTHWNEGGVVLENTDNKREVFASYGQLLDYYVISEMGTCPPAGKQIIK